MKFGIVLPTFVYNEERQKLATAAFVSLEKTIFKLDKPVLFIVEKDNSFSKYINKTSIENVFELEVFKQPENISGTEQTLAVGTDEVLSKFPKVTHTIWMGDDALFHPEWLLQLESLIDRHNNGISWSVYRSAHVTYHKTIDENTYEHDVLVKSICGHGLTITREEWKTWNVNSYINTNSVVDWSVPPGGDTLDLHHAYFRHGERWVTKCSYIQHTGTSGVHVTPDIPEYAINFIG
jgi:hypothetical protein